jgi:ribosomal protein L7/L12
VEDGKYRKTVQEARERFDLRHDTEDVIGFMRSAGFSIIDCIKALRELSGCSLADAKLTVHHSETWSDQREASERLHEELEREVQREAEEGR